MHRFSTRMVAVVAVVGALAAGGAAYTASVTGPTSNSSDGTAGYGQVSVNGATLNSVAYSQDHTPGDASFGEVNGATLVFAGDLTGANVTAEFDGDTNSETNCTVGATSGSGAGETTSVSCVIPTEAGSITANNTSLDVTVTQ